MALDATARESNVRDSYRKYFIDNISKTSKIPLVFDTSLSTPAIHGKKNEIVKWVTINMGSKTLDKWSEVILDIYCCTRNDSEGFVLSQLVDTVMGYLSDTTQTDCIRRIPFYQSHPGGFSNWVLIGALNVLEIIDSGDFEGPDRTKTRLLTVTLGWASKI